MCQQNFEDNERELGGNPREGEPFQIKNRGSRIEKVHEKERPPHSQRHIIKNWHPCSSPDYLRNDKH